MKLIFRSMGKYRGSIAVAVFLKLVGTLAELSIPYILEHIIDDIVPLGELRTSPPTAGPSRTPTG